MLIFDDLKKSYLTFFLIGFYCGLSAITVFAQYRFDSWTTNNGLPQNSVNTILQTRDGYLWLTTFDGLVRYNGAQFTVFNHTNTAEITNQRFESLYEDRDGNLWIKGENGSLTRYRKGRFTAYTTKEGLPHSKIERLGGMADGTMAVQTSNGLAIFRNERFEPIASDPLGFESMLGYCEYLYPSKPAKTVWYRRDTELRRVSQGRMTSFQVALGGADQLYEDRQGRLWIGFSDKEGLGVIEGDALRIYTVKDGLPAGAAIEAFCEDRTGTLWFGTHGGGLVRFKDGSFTTFNSKNGLSSDNIRAIFEDREGLIWIGTPDTGLMRLTPQIITTYAEKDGMVGKAFYPILEDHEGSIWIGNAGLHRFKDGKFTYYPLKPPSQTSDQPYSTVRSIFEDSAGRLLLGGVGDGLAFYRNGKFTFGLAALPRAPLVIYQDRQGALWLGLNGELIREKDGVKEQFNSKDGLQGYVQQIYEDRRGQIWICTYSGLAEYVEGRLRFYTENDGLSSKHIRAIYEDSDGVLWIGTYDGGLNRFKNGRFTRYTTAEGMFSNGVFSILEDQRGNFWMGSNQGIHRVRKQQLNEFADGKVTRIDAISYGQTDGMLSTECNGGRYPSALKASDGRLWFPTLNGVAVVDPEAVSFNLTPPPVVIESVTLDRAALDSQHPVAIHPGQAQLEIAYAGLSFIKPEHVRFKYRMEGLDKDWVEAGNRRVAYFSHLPAGSYTFHVIAANSDGVWNETGARLAVQVYPPFWQTQLFLTLVAMSCLTLAVLLYRARIRKLKHAQTAQEDFARQLLASQEGERKRIAAELHDGLGQNLLVIKNWATLAKRALEPESNALAPIEEVTAAAARSVQEVREIAHNLRPYHLDEVGLTDAIAAMVERVSEASGIRFIVGLDNLNGLLSPNVEINLYRIVQECLNNIVKHAQATEAEVSIHHNAQSLNVVIKDNGQGFDLAWVSRRQDRGFGLAGLAERVRLLGGKEFIQSEPGKGTTIIITLNLP